MNRSPLYDYTNDRGTLIGDLTVVGLHRSHAHILLLAEWVRLMCERLPLSDRANDREVGKLLKLEDAEALYAQAQANVRGGRIVPLHAVK